MDKGNEAIVKQIAKVYNQLSHVYDADQLFVSEHNDERVAEAMEFMGQIESILNQMHHDKALILWNDYFSKRESKWFFNYFAKSTYYRLRSAAIDEFVRCVTA